MESTKTFKLILNELRCANCANKIELRANKLIAVEEATLNFSTTQLHIRLYDVSTKDKVIEEIKKIAQQLDSRIMVLEEVSGLGTQKSSNKEHSFDWLIFMNDQKFLILGSLLFIMTLIFEAHTGLYLGAYLLIGGKVLLTAVRNFKRGHLFDENFLMTIATLGAIFLGEYPEAIAVMLFYEIGEMFQHYAVNRSRQSIGDLLDIRVDYANLVTINGPKVVAIEEVQIGDEIVVKPGERIPLDGVIISGESELDTSALTGESMLRFVTTGEEILAGFINLNAVLQIRVTSTSNTSTVARILELVEHAASKKATTERFITKFCQFYTPLVVLTAILVATIPPLLFGADFSSWLYRALVFLVVSCPCALVVSIPLGFFAGIGGVSKVGVLVKGANYLEILNKVETVVFDKTGTLTKGRFVVSEVHSIRISEQEFIKLAAYAESQSNHPIAKSIVKSYGKTIAHDEIVQYQEIAGRGIKVQVTGQQILIGNMTLMKEAKMDVPQVNSVGTIIYLAVNGDYKGYMVIQDEIKKTSKATIAQLRKIGVKKVVMLTGDGKQVAQKVAADLGIKEVYSQLLPHQKVERVEHLLTTLKGDGKLAFVGDGMNDAPVLARSDVGIAMGGIGSDAAIEAADMVLMKDDPLALVAAIHKSRLTINILYQNIIFALGIKFLVMILSLLGVATMWVAVFADVGVTLLTIINSIRALKK